MNNDVFFRNGQLHKAVLIRQSETGEPLGYQVAKVDERGYLLQLRRDSDENGEVFYPTPDEAISALNGKESEK